MKTFFRRFAAVLLVLTVSCAYQMAGDHGPWDPIFPATNSIIPLKTGIAWVFSHTEYDSLGQKVIPHALDNHFAITRQYGLVNDTEITQLNSSYFRDTFADYAYGYEQENSGKGIIVVYRSLYPLSSRGLYVIGKYNRDTVQLYPREQLWLAYPGEAGKTWTFHPDPINDSAFAYSMELVSTHAPAYRLDSSAMTGITIYDSCYLYRQTNGDTVSYYYYNEEIGNLGFQQYIAGTLRKTLLLKSFTLHGSGEQ